MVQSTGYNINGQNCPRPDVLVKHMKAIQPRWSLIMDNPAMAQDYAREMPNTNFAIRNWGLTNGDENVYDRLSPAAWLEARLPELGIQPGNLYLHTGNEAGIAAKWHIDLMKLVIQRNLKFVKLVICNVAVGNPADIEEWALPIMREFFQLLNDHRDQFVLGLHEYFAGIAPSGFVGGYPDGTWSDGRRNLHANYEDRRTWPQDASDIGTLWHCGRFKVVNDAARGFNIAPPRILITEHGADRVEEMVPWLNKFPVGGGYAEHRAWTSLGELWKRLLPGKTSEQAFFDNIQYLKTAVYRHFPNVEGELLFTWTSNPDKEEFDLSQADEFMTLLEKSVDTTTPTPAPVLPPFPADFDSRAKPYMVRATDGATTVRAKPSQNSDMLTTISPLPGILKLIDVADLWPAERVQQTIGDRLGVWLPVVVGSIKGWSFNAYLDVQPVVVAPPIPDVVKWQIVIDYQGTPDQRDTSRQQWLAMDTFLRLNNLADVVPISTIRLVDKS